MNTELRVLYRVCFMDVDIFKLLINVVEVQKNVLCVDCNSRTEYKVYSGVTLKSIYVRIK